MRINIRQSNLNISKSAIEFDSSRAITKKAAENQRLEESGGVGTLIEHLVRLKSLF